MNRPTFDEEYIYRNDTPSFRFTVTDSATDAILPLNNCTCTFGARADFSSTSHLFYKTSTSGTSLGVVTFQLARADTTTVGTYIADFVVKDSSNKIITSKQFELTILDTAISSSSSSSSA